VSILSGGPILSFSVLPTDPLNIGGYEVPPGAIVNLSQQKIINKTQVGSSEGTIKEFSGFSDWTVTIDFEWPFMLKALVILELKKVVNIWQVEIALPVLNQRMQSAGISHLVIEQIDLPDPDVDHELKCSLKCSSDKQIDLSDPDGMGIMSEKAGVMEQVTGVTSWL
jgi:hypothetical protein